MKSQNRFMQQRAGMICGSRRLWAAVAIVCFVTAAGRGQDVARVQGTAPPDHAVLKDAPGGFVFVPKALKERYDKLLAETQAVQADLDADRIDGDQALSELQVLEGQLKRLREEIEQEKVVVAPVKVYRQSETTTFELGPGRLLVITADNLHVVGWDGPGVKCVLERTVMAPDGQPADDHLKGIKVVRQHGTAPEIVGLSLAEQDAREKEFLATPNGQKLDQKQRDERHQFINRIIADYEPYRAFQGKEIDTIQIEGLTYEQGNRQIVLDVRSPNAGGRVGGRWQRDAALTVYVPTCEGVALRGCLRRLDVQGVRAALLVSSDGSRDRDYEGKFQVRDVFGSLTVKNAPLDLISGIHGNVSIRATVQFTDVTTLRENGQRVFHTPAPRVTTCKDIGGDLTAWFFRADLRLESIAGRIDVRNEFGPTRLTADQALASKPHRVISESGRIEVHLTPEAIGKLFLQALTSGGTIRTNAGQSVLEDAYFTTGSEPMTPHRSWHGVRTSSGGGPASRPSFDLMVASMDRVGLALEGKDRPPGLDFISSSGTVQVVLEP